MVGQRSVRWRQTGSELTKLVWQKFVRLKWSHKTESPSSFENLRQPVPVPLAPVYLLKV